MHLGPVVANVILNISAIRSDSTLACDRAELTDALLLISRRWVAELRVATRQAARALLLQRRERLHRCERCQLGAAIVEASAIIDRANALAHVLLSCADKRRLLMVAFLPYPHVFRIMPAAAVLGDGQLPTRA